ncbi:DUF892 family protein [uncultured Roseobacter sp.]|uniref:DUF892 family protein n=1 Tax=uncultured Roseobacter sp. TaxID=114847 RepID=UPI00262CEA5C|nr:DUF892 family protein [uncultured Roseobacter sp.]
MNNLKDVYIDQLQDLYSANSQSAEVTEALADAATDENLRVLLQKGVSGIRDGMEQVAGLIRGHDADPNGEHCKGMEGLVREARAHALEEDFGDDAARDAMIITQYQRMAHYAIAGYGCVVAFAGRLDLKEDIGTLQDCLDACYDGDRQMTELATSDINAAAA